MVAIGLIPNWSKENTPRVVERVREIFARRRTELLVAESGQCRFTAGASLADELAGWRGRVNLVIVAGGDGTILKSARDLAHWDVPILGINVGHKGFLAEIEYEQMDRCLEDVISGNYEYRERMMLEAVVRRGGKNLGRYLALNDIIVSRGPFSRIVQVDTFIDGEFLDSFSGDGVIVASPTGSTGYSLSAGGPIVNPSLELLVITPICPHTLNNRSVIVTGSETILLQVKSRQAQVALTVDGQVGFALEEDDEVTVFRSQRKVKLVRLKDSSFYRLLHQKLKG
jgi:NAD+ kinase